MIASYIAAHDEPAAERWLQRLDGRLRLLADNPRLGPVWAEDLFEMRSFTLSPYILFYQPLTDGIRLIRVLHGARDMVATLQQD